MPAALSPARLAAAHEAAAKRARGEKLTRDQTRAVETLEQTARDQALRDGLRALPKGRYCELAGRQQKVVDEAARRYGLPLNGPAVDLAAAIKAFHDLIAKNASVLTAAGGADWQQEKLVQQIETLKARRKLLEQDVALRRAELISRDELRERAAWLSDQLRRFVEQLGRRHGREAQQMANDFLGKLATELEDGHAPGRDRT